MRTMTVKRPEKDTATTARDDDQDSSLSGAPSTRKQSTDVSSWPQHMTLVLLLCLDTDSSQLTEERLWPELVK